MLTSDQLVSLTSRSISLSSSSYKLKHERKEIKFIGQKISVMIIFSFLLADYILCFPYHWVNHGFQYAYRRIGVHNSMPFLHESTTIISPRCATTCGTPCDYNLNVHKPSCRDDAAYIQSCLQWFTEGKCKTDVDTMRVLCPDSCGFCRRTYSFGNHIWLWSLMIFVNRLWLWHHHPLINILSYRRCWLSSSRRSWEIALYFETAPMSDFSQKRKNAFDWKKYFGNNENLNKRQK